jgi:hypothetical protein
MIKILEKFVPLLTISIFRITIMPTLALVALQIGWVSDEVIDELAKELGY